MSSFWYLVGRHGIEPCPRCYEQRARTLGPTALMTPGRAEDGPARACLPGLTLPQETYASCEAWRGDGFTRSGRRALSRVWRHKIGASSWMPLAYHIQSVF